MEAKIVTRMGDGSRLEMTASEIRADIEDGVAAAVKRAKVPPLTSDEIDHLCDIFTSSTRFSAVDVGDENRALVGRYLQHRRRLHDRQSARLPEQPRRRHPRAGRLRLLLQGRQDHRHARGAQHEDGAVQLHGAAQLRRHARLGALLPARRPITNWSELMPLGRIDEARASQEAAIELAMEDMLYVCDHLWEGGADGMDFDTAGASGDADLLATLRTVETLRERYPYMGLQVGMASEMVLGMHGQLEYKGRRLAGMWPHDQMQVVQEAGATIFGPAVNVNTTRRSPGTRPVPARSSSPAWPTPRYPCTPTWAWASAACP